MYTETIVLTPDLAQHLLDEYNNNNPRHPSNTHADRIADDILNNRWQYTHQGIAIGTNKQMIDGQHTCLGCIKAGRPIMVRVTYNVPPDRRKYTNSGKPESGLGAWGVPDAHVKVLNAVLVGPSSQHGFSTKLSKDDKAAIYNTTLAEPIAFATNIYPFSKVGVRRAQIPAVIAAATFTVPRDRLRTFATLFGDGASQVTHKLSPGERTVLKLRDDMLKMHGVSGGRSGAFIYSKVERSLVAYLDDEYLRSIFTKDERHFPVPGLK
jgi:hypothetical protein